MEIRVLLTGFDPFDNQTVNPALEVVKQLNGQILHQGGQTIQVHARPVSTVFGKCAEEMMRYVQELQPKVVIAVGQAGGRAHITPERIAINIDDARIPDNEGIQPIDSPIISDGPAAYWSTLPIKRMVETLKAAGIASSVSNSAGTFVCNHLFYRLMHNVHTCGLQTSAGFVHIPFLPEQVADSTVPSMPLSQLVRGLELAILAATLGEADVRVTGGAEW